MAAASKTTPKPTPTGTPATPAPSSTPSSTPPPAKPAPPKPQPTLLFSASGTESGESQAFPPPQHYEVQYAWQCDPAEGSGNFIMSTDDQNGQSEWDGVDVDRLAVSGTAPRTATTSAASTTSTSRSSRSATGASTCWRCRRKADRGQHSPGLPHTEAAVDTQSRASRSLLLQRSRAMRTRVSATVSGSRSAGWFLWAPWHRRPQR